MKCIKQFILILLAFFFCVCAYAQPNKTLIFSASETSTSVMDAYFKFLQTAYNEIGYNLERKKLSDKRAVTSADNGLVDGLVLSSKSILKTYHNIIAIDIPLIKTEIVAYSITKIFKIQSLDSFKPYKIGILRGYPLAVKLSQTQSLQIVDSYDSLFSILQLGRVDVIIILKTEAQRFLNNNPQFKEVKKLQSPIYVIPLYHFLNKKHKALVPQITPIIDRLLKEKLLEELYKPYLN